MFLKELNYWGIDFDLIQILMTKLQTKVKTDMKTLKKSKRLVKKCFYMPKEERDELLSKI